MLFVALEICGEVEVDGEWCVLLRDPKHFRDCKTLVSADLVDEVVFRSGYDYCTYPGSKNYGPRVYYQYSTHKNGKNMIQHIYLTRELLKICIVRNYIKYCYIYNRRYSDTSIKKFEELLNIMYGSILFYECAHLNNNPRDNRTYNLVFLNRYTHRLYDDIAHNSTQKLFSPLDLIEIMKRYGGYEFSVNCFHDEFIKLIRRTSSVLTNNKSSILDLKLSINLDNFLQNFRGLVKNEYDRGNEYVSYGSFLNILSKLEMTDLSFSLIRDHIEEIFGWLYFNNKANGIEITQMLNTKVFLKDNLIPKSKVAGVRYSMFSGRWIVQLHIEGYKQHCGVFSSQKDAEIVANKVLEKSVIDLHNQVLHGKPLWEFGD